MAFAIPSTLKAAQLKSLALQCGISPSGAKTQLASRLRDAISSQVSHTNAGPEWKSQPSEPVRILSIDMGIRNLAYCVLEVPSFDLKTTPVLSAWRRIAVSSAPTPIKLSFPKGDETSSPPDLPAAKESFAPAHLSSLAYNLLTNILLPHKPTHILIERQRFRTMGAAQIQEWTVRVNMLESMLYAILHTLKAQGTIETSVMPIIPGKVTPFWLGTSLARSSKTRKTVEAQDGHMQKVKIKPRASTSPKLLNKQAKIDIVGTWLDGKSTAMIDLGPKEVQKTAAAFLEKWNRLPGRSKTKVILRTAKNKSLVKGLEDEKEEMGKLDDLADCLLQGMAWVKWEQNKKLVFEDGVEALDIG